MAKKGEKISIATRKKMSETKKRLYREGYVNPRKGIRDPRASERMLNYNLSRTYDENFKKKISCLAKKRFEDEEYKKRMLSALMKGQHNRPNSYEKKLISLFERHSFPFNYVGNGTFWIGNKNPDFINMEKNIILEVYHPYFKEKIFKTCDNYERQRKKYFSKYGYQTIFFLLMKMLNLKTGRKSA